jgi:hypothetical protein
MHGFIFFLVMFIKAFYGNGLVLLHGVLLILSLKLPIHQLFDSVVKVSHFVLLLVWYILLQNYPLVSWKFTFLLWMFSFAVSVSWCKHHVMYILEVICKEQNSSCNCKYHNSWYRIYVNLLRPELNAQEYSEKAKNLSSRHYRACSWWWLPLTLVISTKHCTLNMVNIQCRRVNHFHMVTLLRCFIFM